MCCAAVTEMMFIFIIVCFPPSCWPLILQLVSFLLLTGSHTLSCHIGSSVFFAVLHLLLLFFLLFRFEHVTLQWVYRTNRLIQICMMRAIHGRILIIVCSRSSSSNIQRDEDKQIICREPLESASPTTPFLIKFKVWLLRTFQWTNLIYFGIYYTISEDKMIESQLKTEWKKALFRLLTREKLFGLSCNSSSGGKSNKTVRSLRLFE